MKCISSPSTSLLKTSYFIVGVGFLIGAVACLWESILHAIVFSVAAVALIYAWWRYTRHATTVFLTDDGFKIESNLGEFTIPRHAVISIRLIPFLRYPVTAIRYENSSGIKREVIFFPMRSAFNEVENLIDRWNDPKGNK